MLMNGQNNSHSVQGKSEIKIIISTGKEVLSSGVAENFILSQFASIKGGKILYFASFPRMIVIDLLLFISQIII